MSTSSYRDLFSLQGRVAVVAGGAGLIGREIAQAYLDFGATVFVAERPEAAEKVPAGALFLELDVASEQSAAALVQSVMEQAGRLDVLVNCAYPRTADWGAKFEAVPPASLRENLERQLGGCFILCQAVAEAMKARGGGSIINLGSIYGSVGPDFSIYQGTPMTMPAAYAAIKGGVIGFSRYLATYYASHGVRVNVLSPGGIEDRQPEAFTRRYGEKTPLGRMGKPSEMAGAAVFLASEASSYVTGIDLKVDGGWTAW